MHILTKPLFRLRSIISLQRVKHLVWCLLLACYFLQVPFRLLSRFITIFAFVFLLLTYKDWLRLFRKPLFCLYGVYLATSALVSAFNPNTSVSKVIRFSEIFLTIPMFFCIDVVSDEKFYAKAIVRIAMLKAVVIFIIYGIVIQTGSYAAVRAYGHQNGWGDVYTFGSVFLTRVQLQGNALLVMACFTAFYIKDRVPYKLALLAACLIAGNKAFLIGLFLFALYGLFSWAFNVKKLYGLYLKIGLLMLCTMLISPIVIGSVVSILEEKAGYSNVVRKDQAEVLMSGNIITGNGVGNTIVVKTAYRDYTDADYFELQTLYVINQIGIFGYLLFLVLTFGLCMDRKNAYFLCFVYFTYLAYTFFNPYCFDTTHMMTGFLICSIFSANNKERVLK